MTWPRPRAERVAQCLRAERVIDQRALRVLSVAPARTVLRRVGDIATTLAPLVVRQERLANMVSAVCVCVMQVVLHNVCPLAAMVMRLFPSMEVSIVLACVCDFYNPSHGG